jgi:protein-tyrosine phosphatase
MPPFTVLQLCMGNICRSPMAERLLVLAARELVGDCDELLHVHSAGTGGWHVGEAMDAQAARQLRERGGEPAGFRARKLGGDHIEASDLILTATADQQQHVVSQRPDAAGRTFVIGEFGRLLGSVDLAALPAFRPDPDAVYARGVAIVEAVDALRAGRPAQRGDELDDPWGRGERYFSRVADDIEATVQPFARALFGAGRR